MRPLCFAERERAEPSVSFGALVDGNAPTIAGRCALGLSDYVDEIVRGGWPGMRRYSGAALLAQLDSYLDRIVDHDLPEAGHRVRRPASVRAWLRAYAAATATTASWESIRDAATPGHGNKPARGTTLAYTELLTALRVLDPIDAWTPSQNVFARLGAAPKHHLADPALAARLLDRTTRHLLTGDERGVPRPREGTLLGNLFESLVALSVRTHAQASRAPVFHLRADSGRREVDFIVEHEGGVLAIEAKLSATIDDGDVRHLVALRAELGDRWIDGVVINTGPEAYRRPDGIAVIPLGLLGA
jgi:predicted AAA+ superfamily ATPase